MYMLNQCCYCYSKPILDVADNKFAESAAVLMLNDSVYKETEHRITKHMLNDFTFNVKFDEVRSN